MDAQRIQVLLASDDDELVSRVVAELAVLDVGADVRRANDGAQALAATSDADVPPVLVLLDDRLPGSEPFLEHLRADPALERVAVVALAARRGGGLPGPPPPPRPPPPLRPAGDLPEPGEPGSHVEPRQVLGLVVLELVLQRRPGTDQRHVAGHDVDQLRELVEARRAQQA